MFLTLLFSMHTHTANAAETIDIGVLKNSDMNVVQKMLYPKTGKTEMGGHLGWMPFDAFTSTPKMEGSYGMHISETLGWEVVAGAGYGIKNGTFRRLEGPSYGITPDAYRYLGSLIGDAQYTPAYAKFNWLGKQIYHHDIYVLGGAGVTMEESFMPDKDFSFAPTFSCGVGARVFLPEQKALRIQLRDDFLLQKREKTAENQGLYLKQNTTISVGLVLLES